MGKVSTVSTGPQLGNRFATGEVIKAMKDVSDQQNLNSTVNRINNIKSAYDRIPSEGQRVADTVHERGKIMASTGADRAQQLRTIMDKSIGTVQQSTSKDMAGKTALVQASNQASVVESGKGGKVSTNG